MEAGRDQARGSAGAHRLILGARAPTGSGYGAEGAERAAGSGRGGDTETGLLGRSNRLGASRGLGMARQVTGQGSWGQGRPLMSCRQALPPTQRPKLQSL